MRVDTRFLLRATRVTMAMAITCALGVPGICKAGPPQASLSGPLEANIADGFSLAAVGDVIMANPQAADTNPAFQAQLRILRAADVVFGNFEGTAIDLRDFRGSPQAESGGQWLLSSPGVP